MQQSDTVRLLASRPSGAAFASLFSDHSEAPVAMRKTRSLRAPALGGIGREIVRRARAALLSQVPCEDVSFHTPPTLQFARHRTQT